MLLENVCDGRGDFQGWNHRRTPFSISATVRAVTRS
jgi:hypothetical protein